MGERIREICASVNPAASQPLSEPGGLAPTADHPQVRRGRVHQGLDHRLIQRMIVGGDDEVVRRAALQLRARSAGSCEQQLDSLREALAVGPLGRASTTVTRKPTRDRQGRELAGHVTRHRRS